MRVNPDSKEAGGLSDYEVGVEVSNSIIAATNATGITLTYIFWELACHPEWQDKLREELKGVETDGAGGGGAVWYKDIATLPVLNAVVNEAMRKNPAFPASLPRMPPAGGAVIDGVFVPANGHSHFSLPRFLLFTPSHNLPYVHSSNSYVSQLDRCIGPILHPSPPPRDLSVPGILLAGPLARHSQRDGRDERAFRSLLARSA